VRVRSIVEQDFTATVYDQSNKKMSGVKLTWSLTSAVAGCSISSTGKFTTTAETTPLGTYTNLVQAQVTGADILGQATVSVLAMPFTGGVFIGTCQCTSNCDIGEDRSPLAIVATATTFKALTIDTVDGTAAQFSGTIKDANVAATFTSPDGGQISISGSITFGATGIASGGTASWSQVGGSESGTVTLSAVSAHPGPAPKLGHGLPRIIRHPAATSTPSSTKAARFSAPPRATWTACCFTTRFQGSGLPPVQ